MNLLVLDSDSSSAEGLGKRTVQRLSELGYQPHLTAEPRVASDMAAQSPAGVIFCCEQRFLDALSGIKPGISIFLVTEHELSHAELVSAMRAGVSDCWIVGGEDDLPRRINCAVEHSTRVIKDVSAELSEMRSELERDQRAGQYIQMGMLPPNPMAIGRFRLQHKVAPSLILSGDFVDYFQITDRYFACYVADVAGHGASSAFVTVLLKNFSRRLRREYRQSMLSHPGEILSWINTELLDQGIDKHVAMFLATVDLQERRLHYSNAAHFPPAAMVTPSGIVFLEQKGKPLGLFEDLSFESLSVQFAQGDRLVVFSDGVLDLVPRDSLEEKEAYLEEAIIQAGSMKALWERLDTSRLGSDDVSCLMVEHGN